MIAKTVYKRALPSAKSIPDIEVKREKNPKASAIDELRNIVQANVTMMNVTKILANLEKPIYSFLFHPKNFSIIWQMP